MINWTWYSGCIHFSHSQGEPRVGGHSPECIIIHYTAGSLPSTLSWFLNPKSKVSAHLVIGRAGDVYELVKPKYIAWHAGRSTWRGRSRVNQFSYGIEMVSSEKDGFTFTEAQYETLRVVLWGGIIIKAGVVSEIPGVANTSGLVDYKIGTTDAQILGHEHVSPGRKSDPGCNFDWSKIKATIVVKDDAEELRAEAREPPIVKTRWYTSLFRKLLEAIQ